MKLHKSRFIILISLLCLFLPSVLSAEQITKKVHITDSASSAKISIHIADSDRYVDVRLFLTRSADPTAKKVYFTMQKSEADFVLDIADTAAEGEVGVYFTDTSREANIRIFFASNTKEADKSIQFVIAKEDADISVYAYTALSRNKLLALLVALKAI